jgi:hypothetical protein
MHRVMSGSDDMAGSIEHDGNLTGRPSFPWTRLPVAALTLVNFKD